MAVNIKNLSVGTKVKIRNDLEVDGWYGEDVFNKSMEKFKGEFVTIRKILPDKNKFEVEECGWNFTPEMVVMKNNVRKI